MQNPVNFFDTVSWGTLIEPVRVTPPDRPPERVCFKHGLVENFEFGWSRDTTYDVYRAKATQLLALAAEQTHEDVTQTLLQAAVVFTVSGLETLVNLHTCERASQDIDEYEEVLKNHPRFVASRPGDLTALRRLFCVRHAIVHAGARVTEQLFGNINQRAARNEPILLSLVHTRAVVEAADRFADRTERILGLP